MEENKGFPFRKLIIGLSVLTVIALAGTACYVTLYLGIFTVQEIHISGNKRIMEREIAKRSGLMEGASSIFFFESRVEEDILKNPWISSVTVTKEFPKIVHIKIEEEDVYCMVLAPDGKPLYMSRTGRILDSGNFDLGLDFPVLIGEGIKDPQLLGEALDILKLSNDSSVLNWDDISEVHVDPIYGINVFTNDRLRIEFDRDDVSEKWDKVERIMRYSDTLGLEESYINVSSASTGVVDFARPSSGPGAQDG